MVDSGVLDQLSGTFSLSWWTAIPALLILILPLCKVPIRPTMAVSALTALLVTVFAQGRALLPSPGGMRCWATFPPPVRCTTCSPAAA